MFLIDHHGRPVAITGGAFRGIEQDALLVLDELLDVLVERVRSEGVELLGPGGLLSQVTKAVLGAFVG
ncbi:hypothetical protein [Candidatus Poriferisocius sp.]|uniref:hypothetical protein n=1 Tax=Candidatus Poriferisocius sp. TaxID=3101276 RepID=UPI003B01A89E